MTYTAYACETVTGKNISPLDINVNAWARELNGTDTASVILAPGALTVKTRDNLRLLTTPWRMSLAICWNGIPVFYGPFVTREWKTSLQLNAVGTKSIFLRRKAHTWALPLANMVLTYTNMSLGGIAGALLQVGMNHPGGSLPIIAPPSEADSDPTHTRTYFGYESKNISDLWDELTGVANGPDIDFVPSWTDSTQSYMQVTMRTGTVAQPKLGSTNQVVFDAAQPESSVSELDYTEDASQLTTTEWSAGSGTDVGILMSRIESDYLVGNNFPLLEEEVDYKTVSDQATLDSSATGDLNVYGMPIIEWSLKVDATKPPALTSYNVGDPCRVRIVNHVWLPDGDYNMRIVGIAGDSSTMVTLQVQGA